MTRQMDGNCRESISRSVSGELTRHLGEVFRKLAVQKESKIGEGHLMPDHVHMMICIPPKMRSRG